MIQGTWVNTKKKPFDDPRVRRALHLAFDRPTLVDVVKDVTPMQVGGFIYPFSEFATPKEELFKRLGYQDDPTAAIKEAKALMAAAGHANGIKGLDFLVRDVPSFKLWAQAIQAMLQESAERRSATCAPSSNRCGSTTSPAGNFDLAIGAIVSTLLDPSDYFNAWYRNDGPQNYSFWNNEKFNALVDQIDREVDPAKRMALDPPGRGRSWSRTRRCCRSPGRRSTTSGTTTSRATIPTIISASTTSCAGHVLARQGVIEK